MSALAAVFYWIAVLTLMPTDGSANLFASSIGAMVAAVPLLAFADRNSGALTGLISFLMVTYSTALIAMVVFWGEGSFHALRGWPLVLTALACGASSARFEARPHIAWLLGLALWSGAAIFAGLTHPAILALMTQSPVHLAITLAFSGALMMILLSFAVDPVPVVSERFVSALSGLLPVLGFTGTVLGIMRALQAMPAIFDVSSAKPEQIQEMLGGLALAFETTLLGLVASVALAVISLALTPFGPQDA